ncbi:unnamed protein product [Rhodiola kirilowii]
MFKLWVMFATELLFPLLSRSGLLEKLIKELSNEDGC